MENFWKKRASNEAKQSINQNNSDDSYIQDIEKRITSKVTGGIMAENLDQFYTEEVYDFEEKNRLASNRVKSLIVLYASLFGALVNTSLIYYPSIKIVRKLFGLKGFWNIHFAALPLIMTWNAVTLGMATGIYQSFQAKKLLKEMESKGSFDVWKI